MFLLNNVKVHPDIQRTIGDVQYPAGWFSNPEAREKVGMIEVPDPVRPDDSLYASVENPDGSYTATPRTAADVAACRASKDAEQANLMRATRNEKLSETDWRFRSDMTPSQAWKDYCQALRDITLQAGFPWSIDWPAQP